MKHQIKYVSMILSSKINSLNTNYNLFYSLVWHGFFTRDFYNRLCLINY